MSLIVEVLVDSRPLPVTSFLIHGNAHGSVGSIEIHTSLTQLARKGVDLVAMSVAASSSLPIDIYVSDSGASAHIFGGEFVSAKYSYRKDTGTINGRDWAGPLVDQKRVLTSILKGNTGALAPDQSATSKGVSTQNQKLSALVTAIANQFDLTADIRLASGPGNDPDVGAIFGAGGDTVFSPTPQSLWSILTRLARETGNVVYATPQKHLVFGAPGAGLAPLLFTWRVSPAPLGAHPVLSLDIDHNPRRNQTFRVLVLSYDPTNQQLTRGQAYVVGSDYSTSQGATVHAGAWSGAQASAIQSAIGNKPANKADSIQLYTFHVDGLTAAQAQQRATALANDIAKRELVATLSCNVIATIAPSNPARLSGLIASEFSSHTYYVTGYTHEFRMGDKPGTSEYISHVTLLDRQPEGTGKPVSAKGTKGALK